MHIGLCKNSIEAFLFAIGVFNKTYSEQFYTPTLQSSTRRD